MIIFIIFFQLSLVRKERNNENIWKPQNKTYNIYENKFKTERKIRIIQLLNKKKIEKWKIEQNLSKHTHKKKNYVDKEN